MAKTTLYNMGNRFGWHSDPSIEATPKHPLHALGNLVTYLGGDVYSAAYGGVPLTKLQILEDQFAVEGTWGNPPEKVMQALYAERVTIEVSYDGMVGSSVIRRGDKRAITNGEEDEEPVIDEEATRFFEPDTLSLSDFIFATPDISIWTAHHHVTLSKAMATGGISSSRQFFSPDSFTQSTFTPGTAVDEYEVDTGVPLGEGTYSLRFVGSTGALFSRVTVEFRQRALYIAKHSVWILPFSVVANNQSTSSFNVVQDSVYESMILGEYGGTILEAQYAEYEAFYGDNPDEFNVSRPNGSGLSVSGVIYSGTPQTLVTYDDPPPEVFLSSFKKMPVFLPGEV